mmetsp:Transcript_3725/g.9037  ORF Transcript_3725/g.9037 Transcript_3725/m.9037 type:complete len:240 (+) Transcript_3725:41-760(+)
MRVRVRVRVWFRSQIRVWVRMRVRVRVRMWLWFRSRRTRVWVRLRVRMSVRFQIRVRVWALRVRPDRLAPAHRRSRLTEAAAGWLAGAAAACGARRRQWQPRHAMSRLMAGLPAGGIVATQTFSGCRAQWSRGGASAGATWMTCCASWRIAWASGTPAMWTLCARLTRPGVRCVYQRRTWAGGLPSCVPRPRREPSVLGPRARLTTTAACLSGRPQPYSRQPQSAIEAEVAPLILKRQT